MNNNRQHKPDHIYFNIDIVNPNNSDNEYPATYDNTFPMPVLTKPSDYHFTVARLNMPGYSFPLFSWPSNNEFSVTLVYQGSVFTEFLVYPISPLPSAAAIYEISEMMNIINTHMTGAFNAMKAAFPGSAATLPPLIRHNSDNDTCELYFEESGYGDPNIASTSNLHLWFNFPLTLLFRFNYDIYNAAIGNLNSRLRIQDYGWNFEANFRYPGGTTANSLRMITGQGSASDTLAKLDRLVITSSSIPAVPESKNAQSITTTGDFDNINQTPDPIIFDLSIEADGFLQSSSLVYNARLYRLVDLISDLPFYTINFNFYYTERGSEALKQLTLSPGSTLSIKLLFIKRSVLSNSEYVLRSNHLNAVENKNNVVDNNGNLHGCYDDSDHHHKSGTKLHHAMSHNELSRARSDRDAFLILQARARKALLDKANSSVATGSRRF